MTLGQEVAQRLKLLKRLVATLYTSGSVSFTLTWSVDFGSNSGSITQTVPVLGTTTQYGVSQYGVDQYGASGQGTYLFKYASHIRGQYYQLGLSSTVSGPLAMQQAQFTAKIGRIA
jgi:hypothetical protein